MTGGVSGCCAASQLELSGLGLFPVKVDIVHWHSTFCQKKKSRQTSGNWSESSSFNLEYDMGFYSVPVVIIPCQCVPCLCHARDNTVYSLLTVLKHVFVADATGLPSKLKAGVKVVALKLFLVPHHQISTFKNWSSGAISN